MPVIFKSVGVRIALLYMAIFGVSVALILGLVLYVGQNLLMDQIRSRIMDEVRFLGFEYAEDGLAELLEETEERIEKSGYERRLQYVVQSPTGEVIFDDFHVDKEQIGWQRRETLDSSGREFEFLFYFDKLDNDYVLGVGSDLSIIAGYRAAILRAVLLTLLISIGVSSVFGLLLGRYVSVRIKRVIRALQEVSKGRLDTRIDLKSGGYEFEILSLEINKMFQKVEDLLVNLKHISRGLAHDLRTPLAVAKNRLRGISDALGVPALQIEKAEQDIDNVLKYLESSLLVSELESGELSASFDTVNLSELTEQMIDSYRPLLEDAGIRCLFDLRPDLLVWGDAGLLKRLLANALDNVLLHAGRDGDMSAHLFIEKPQVVFILENSIFNIDKSDTKNSIQSRCAQRYGMGLKISRAIAKLHNGDLSISQEDGKFSFRVTLFDRY